MAKKIAQDLLDDLARLKGELTGDEINEIGSKLDCSQSTMYNYFNGKIANKFIAETIRKEGNKIIASKTI